MAESLGKKWEAVFKKSWTKQLPGQFILRLQDNLNGFKDTSENPCDFICAANGKVFMVECKEHKKASIPFTAIPQYPRLLKCKNFENAAPGVLIWFSEKDIIIWVDIIEMEKMVLDGEKSIGIRMLQQKSYDIKVIPAEKKQIFMEPDCLEFIRLAGNRKLIEDSNGI